MPDEQPEASGRRLARDFRRIREEAGVSIDALHQETKIPLGVLESFEESALFGHDMFNRVYLRSMVRTYARQVGIAPDEASAALDEAFRGEYEGGLSVGSPGDEDAEAGEAQAGEASVGEAEDAEAASHETEAGASAEAGASEDESAPAEDQARPSEEPESESEGEESIASESVEREPEETEFEDAEAEEDAEPRADEESKGERDVEAAAAAPVVDAEEEEYDEGELETQDTDAGDQPAQEEAEWETQSPAPVERREGARRTSTESGGSSSSSTAAWVGGGLLLVVLALGLWIFWPGGEAEPRPANGQEEADPVQTTMPEAEEPAQRQASAREPIQLGDTLRFIVRASGGAVRELRVRPDENIRRPYWIEEGEERTFTASDRIVFSPPLDATSEAPLDSMTLLLEGVELPTDQRDGSGRIVIDRARAQSWIDSLRSR